AALALSQLDKFEEVITLLKELSTENWDNFSFNICIKALIKLDRKPEALLLMFQLGEENWERNHLLMAVRTLNELEHYNRVIDLLKNRDLDSGLSKELAVATLGQYRERTTLQDTTDHKPEDINALGESMVAFNRQKLYEEALELAYSIDQTKWNTKIFNSAAISLNGLNRFEETVEILQTNPRSNWDNISYTLCATAFTRTNRPNDALLTLENVPPNQVTMHIRNCAVQAMIVLEQYEDGYTYMEEGGRQEWDAVSYNLAAIALDRMEKYEDALDLIRSMSNEMRDGMHYSLAKSIARKIGPEAMDAVRDTLAPIGHTPKAKVIEHIIDEQKGIAWKAMKEIFEKDSTMQFIPEQANRGGLTADINGIRTFLPASQLALAHTVRGTTLQDIERGLNALVGQNFSVKIISLNENRHNVVVSEIANTTILTNKSFEKLRVGDIRDGIVTSIVQYGLFVAFDNLEGLVHLSEISWSKIEDSSSAATIGDKIKVKVIGIKDDKISLSLKQLSENPLEKYEVNKIIKGRVRRFTNYGAFIEIEPGIMGLIHISELAVDRVSNPQDILKINQLVDTKIISLDKEKRRIGLSLKNLRQNTDSTIDDQETKIEEQGKPDIPKEEVNNLELPSTENLEIKNDEHYPEATSIITNPVTTINFEKYLIEIKSEISALRRSLLTLKIQKESDKDAYSTLIIELYEKLLKLLPEINQELYKEDINLICDQIELLANQYVKHVMGDEIYARLHVLKRFIQSIPASSRSSHTLSPDTIHENNEGILIVSAEESKPISIDINNPIPDLNLNEDEYPITESHTPALNGQEIESENTPQTINLHKDQATEIPTPIDTIAMPEKKELSRDELWPKAEECINNALMKCQKILKDSKKIDKEKVGNVTKYYFKVYKDIYIKYCPIFLKNPFEIEPLLNRWKETVYCSLHIYFTELKKVNNDLVQETLVEMQKFVNFICEEFVKIDPQANYEILKNIMASKITIKGVENIKSIDGKDFILELSNALSKVLLNIRELKKEKLIAEASNEVRSILQVAKDIYPDKPYFDFLDIKKIELVVSGTKFIAKKNGLKGDNLAGQEFAGML
ncbi:MAG: ribosomal protein, partial [Segetibacter sp.]|nr:ribosomal protein [Segetibacter sp.]